MAITSGLLWKTPLDSKGEGRTLVIKLKVENESISI